ncbi:MAG: hypothetical protein CMJ48_03020 [Planctomycetaceae bacterium]|nr:hypothetical protein [Planctomycetaceae bacterium]
MDPTPEDLETDSNLSDVPGAAVRTRTRSEALGPLIEIPRHGFMRGEDRSDAHGRTPRLL